MGDKSPISYTDLEDDATIYISYPVTNHERSKKFYQDVFGWEVTFDGGPEVGWCEFQLPAPRTRFGISQVRDQESFSPITSLNLSVKDLEGTKKYIESNSIKTEDIVDLPGMISMFNMYDPDGNIITFLAEPRVKTESK